MKRLIYADTNSYGVFHRGFNGSSLAMFAAIYEEIVYVATPSSANIIRHDMGGVFPDNISYRKIWINAPNSKFGKILHHFLQSLNSIAIVLFANKNDVVYFNYCPLLALLFINFIAKVTRKKVIITWHNELSTLLDDNPFKYNLLSTFILKKIQFNRYKWAQSILFCFPGKHIKENAIKLILGDSCKQKIISFEHTWLFSKTISINVGKEKQQKNIAKNIHIGFVGTAREERWLNDIINFRKKISAKITITVIGRVFCKPDVLVNNNIQFIPGSEKDFISDNMMKKRLHEMSFIVFLYPQNSYKLTASGSIFDAIDAEKYILGLHNDCFDSLFDSRVHVGKLFNSIEDIILFVNNTDITIIPSLDYHYIKHRLSPSYEANTFKDELNKIDFI